MKRSLFLALVLLITDHVFGATVAATYTAGDIPTNYLSYSAACNGPLTTLTVNLPAGGPWQVTSLDVVYDMTAQAGAWKSEQRSRIYCQNTTTGEASFASGSGSSGGTQGYSRTGLSIANGAYAGGTALIFEMQAYRTWGSAPACDVNYNKVDNNTWTITVTYVLATPMTFSSSNATQNNTSAVAQGATDKEIIGVEVFTTGSSPTIDLTQFQINMNGTTSLADVTNIDIFYTGTSATYSPVGLFGNAAPAGGTIIINGTQTLATGTNYFWIAYDVAGAATPGNLLDAQCTQITVDGSNYGPANSNPAGDRPIATGSPDDPWPGMDLGTLPCPGTVNNADNTSGANNDCTLRGSPDHMYQFTLSVAADIDINLCTGTSWDSYLYLYNITNGNCGGGSIASNDDGCSPQSRITQTPLAAGTYVVVVEGFGVADAGAYNLEIVTSNCAIPPDDPCTALAITVGCSGTKETVDNTTLTNSGVAAPSCGSFAGGDAWFSAVVPASGLVQIETYEGTLADMAMSVYSTSGGCAGTLTEITCDDNSGFGNMPSINLSGQTPGNTLYIRVWDKNNDQNGTFDIEVLDPISDFCITNDAVDLGGGCAQLTAAVNGQLGSIWDTDDKLDFTSDWTYDFTVNLGSSDAGADGIAFVIQNDPAGLSAIGAPGGSVGAGGISNSLIIEIDTYLNTEDRDDGIPGVLCAGGPDPDHMDIWLNGNVNPAGVSCPASPGARIIANAEKLLNGAVDYNIENGNDHILRVDYVAATQTITASIWNQALTINYATVSYSPVDPMVLFGTTAPYFGFTGSTGGLNNLQTACLAPAFVLPIDLLTFSGYNDGNVNIIEWLTASELENNHFVLEKSIDGKSFEVLGTRAGAGTSQSLLRYEMIDKDPFTPYTYYRLKQVDNDGQYGYSNIITVKMMEQTGFSVSGIYPNPAKDQFSFSIYGAKTDRFAMEVTIIDVSGRTVQRHLFEELTPYQEATVETEDLERGIYFVNFRSGAVKQVKKLVLY